MGRLDPSDLGIVIHRVISLLFLLWGIAYAGLVVFSFGIATEEHWATLVREGRIRAEYAQYIAEIPIWVIGMTFVAAATRLSGAIGLVKQKSWAFPVYLLSLGVVVILMYRGFFVADVASVIRPSQVLLEIGFFALSVAAVGFSRFQIANGYLK